MKYLLLLLLLTIPAYAQDDLPEHRKVPINFYCVRGYNPGSFSFEDCRALIRTARRYLRETANIWLLIRDIEQIDEPFPALTNSPNNGLTYLYSLEDYFSGTYPRRPKFVVGQPFIDANGDSWIMGYSRNVCTRGNFKEILPNVEKRPNSHRIHYSLASYYNRYGQDRYWQSLNALIHELGHMLGANHVSENFGINLMNEAALRNVNGGVLPWNKVSLVEINYCARGDY